MKKLFTLIIFILFLLFAYFGYKAAAKFFSGSKTETNSSSINQDIRNTQQNFLLLHVDDLTSDKPKLISVWVTFVYFSDSPQMLFKPLYPSSNLKIQSNIDQYFSLDSKKHVSNAFVNKLSDQYRITVSGYVVIDNNSLSYFNYWLNNDSTQINASPASTPEEQQIILYNGQQFLNSMCELFLTGASNSLFSSIDWTVLLPGHFGTDLPFEKLELALDLINRAPTISQCAVLSSN